METPQEICQDFQKTHQSCQTIQDCIHGFQVPKDYNDAIRLDKENSNKHWQEIHEYKVFKDTGKAQFHNEKVVTPDGFQKIRVHFVYAVKHDGRFKVRLVADGNITKEPVDSIYSGVVSLRSL